METQRHMFKPAKLLICFVERRRGDMLVAATKAAGARGGTVAPGRTVGGNRFLQALSLADISQDIVFTIVGEEAPAVLEAVKAAAARDPKKLGGLAVSLDVSGMLFRVPPSDVAAGGPLQHHEEKAMESGYKLITIIVNHGYADDVMAAARKAGATGGTILTARGTGTEEDVRFFGISLVPEKEMLMIVSAESKTGDIMAAVNALDQIQQPGGGVVYVMNVEQFLSLGKTREGDL
ncbi:MAG: P-II family nitrogen regulator [Candidatus Adiutrix sp.]|jgi:nitrogen regulatory protein PII|nr:P-II family nitrogen regulator [Candidatus Adiutrix sp.]